MSDVKIGTLWIGPRFGPIEAACAQSMLAQGHAVTLFSDGPVDNVPDGVDVADYREITGERPVLRYREMNHPALFSNIFRYQLLARGGFVWADLDVFLLRPLAPADGYLFGRQDEKVINTAILGLPRHSPALRDLTRFCDRTHPVPPFFKRRKRASLMWRRATGRGVPITDLPWGSTGPNALTHFLNEHGEATHAASPEVYYQIPWPDWRRFLEPSGHVRDLITPRTRAVHLWNKFLRAELEGGGPPPGSFAAELFAAV